MTEEEWPLIVLYVLQSSLQVWLCPGEGAMHGLSIVSIAFKIRENPIG